MAATPGRNEPCPCGSGKKYKQCCLAKDEAAAREARARAAEAEAKAVPPDPAAEDEKADKGDKAESARLPPRATRHQTHQPWKKQQGARGPQKFTTPRRSGAS